MRIPQIEEDAVYGSKALGLGRGRQVHVAGLHPGDPLRIGRQARLRQRQRRRIGIQRQQPPARGAAGQDPRRVPPQTHRGIDIATTIVRLQPGHHLIEQHGTWPPLAHQAPGVASKQPSEAHVAGVLK
jgi:hypothetical protein